MTLTFDPTNRQADCLDIRDHVEWDMVEKERKSNLQAFDLFKLYHQLDIHKKHDELIEIDTEKIFSNDILLKLQKKVIEGIDSRAVAIESMPTSNVRISFYRDHSEHHIHRWLKGGERPIAVLGSDDTGIFATNLRNEYAHVYELLITHGLPARESYDLLKKIHEHSGAYIF